MIAITATRKRIESNENITLIDKRMILSTLRISIYIPTTDTADTPILYTHHTQTPNRATLQTNFMLIPAGASFCFIICFSFLIIMTFFFFCGIRQVGHFCFIEQQEVL